MSDKFIPEEIVDTPCSYKDVGAAYWASYEKWITGLWVEAMHSRIVKIAGIAGAGKSEFVVSRMATNFISRNESILIITQSKLLLNGLSYRVENYHKPINAAKIYSTSASLFAQNNTTAYARSELNYGNISDPTMWFDVETKDEYDLAKFIKQLNIKLIWVDEAIRLKGLQARVLLRAVKLLQQEKYDIYIVFTYDTKQLDMSFTEKTKEEKEYYKTYYNWLMEPSFTMNMSWRCSSEIINMIYNNDLTDKKLLEENISKSKSIYSAPILMSDKLQTFLKEKNISLYKELISCCQDNTIYKNQQKNDLEFNIKNKEFLDLILEDLYAEEKESICITPTNYMIGLLEELVATITKTKVKQFEYMGTYQFKNKNVDITNPEEKYTRRVVDADTFAVNAWYVCHSNLFKEKSHNQLNIKNPVLYTVDELDMNFSLEIKGNNKKEECINNRQVVRFIGKVGRDFSKEEFLNKYNPKEVKIKRGDELNNNHYIFRLAKNNIYVAITKDDAPFFSPYIAATFHSFQGSETEKVYILVDLVRTKDDNDKEIVKARRLSSIDLTVAFTRSYQGPRCIKEYLKNNEIPEPYGTYIIYTPYMKYSAWNKSSLSKKGQSKGKAKGKAINACIEDINIDNYNFLRYKIEFTLNDIPENLKKKDKITVNKINKMFPDIYYNKNKKIWSWIESKSLFNLRRTIKAKIKEYNDSPRYYTSYHLGRIASGFIPNNICEDFFYNEVLVELNYRDFEDGDEERYYDRFIEGYNDGDSNIENRKNDKQIEKTKTDKKTISKKYYKDLNSYDKLKNTNKPISFNFYDQEEIWGIAKRKDNKFIPYSENKIVKLYTKQDVKPLLKNDDILMINIKDTNLICFDLDSTEQVNKFSYLFDKTYSEVGMKSNGQLSTHIWFSTEYKIPRISKNKIDILGPANNQLIYFKENKQGNDLPIIPLTQDIWDILTEDWQ